VSPQGAIAEVASVPSQDAVAEVASVPPEAIVDRTRVASPGAVVERTPTRVVSGAVPGSPPLTGCDSRKNDRGRDEGHRCQLVHGQFLACSFRRPPSRLMHSQCRGSPSPRRTSRRRSRGNTAPRSTDPSRDCPAYGDRVASPHGDVPSRAARPGRLSLPPGGGSEATSPAPTPPGRTSHSSASCHCPCRTSRRAASRPPLRPLSAHSLLELERATPAAMPRWRRKECAEPSSWEFLSDVAPVSAFDRCRREPPPRRPHRPG
jgi:hypothetical protein